MYATWGCSPRQYRVSANLRKQPKEPSSVLTTKVFTIIRDEVGLRNSSNTFNIPATLQLLISKGDGTFSKGQTIVAATGSLAKESPGTVLTGDFDGDSKPDVTVTYDDITNLGTTLQVFYGDGAGHLGSPFMTVDPKHYSDSGPTVADVNNDGRSDIVSDGDTNAGLSRF